ncbi:amidohydrolase family protein, partial [Bacteroidales bacterium AH-315-I05]|nr:amidohydrolase family protein [Bacteroidales bacterium AH-315-I05]
IATHCEDEETIQKNSKSFREKYGENVPIEYHAQIRSAEACYRSSSLAAELASKHNTRLHILHISTEKELELFRNDIPLSEKKITAEACIHHLWFSDEDYKTRGAFIKWNPAVKTARDRDAVFQAVLDDRIDVIATDHAPHTLEEKQQSYFNGPSGGPMVQHSLVAMLEFYRKGKISLEKIAEKMCHNPAILFQIEKRGFIREGYAADLVLVDLNSAWEVTKSNILYKCGWSPMEGAMFQSKVTHTFVNGNLVYEKGNFNENIKGQRLLFER